MRFEPTLCVVQQDFRDAVLRSPYLHVSSRNMSGRQGDDLTLEPKVDTPVFDQSVQVIKSFLYHHLNRNLWHDID